jgi:hypothetical protein
MIGHRHRAESAADLLRRRVKPGRRARGVLVAIAAVSFIVSLLLVELIARQVAGPVYSRDPRFRSTPADEWSDPSWRAPPRRVLRSSSAGAAPARTSL